MCESFFATLECELIDRRRFRSRSEARMAVFQFIEGFYNPSRRHSAVGYRFSDRWSTAFGNGLSPRDYT
jgi:putative transposase